MKQRASSSRGFTLMELMVALAIGSLIVLTASQLFFNGALGFKKVEELSERQAALTFVTDVLMDDIRRADLAGDCGSGGVLAFQVDGVCHRYTLAEGTLSLSVEGDQQPVINGIVALERRLDAAQGCDRPGLYCLELTLEGEAQPMRFQAMNRTLAVTGH